MDKETEDKKQQIVDKFYTTKLIAGAPREYNVQSIQKCKKIIVNHIAKAAHIKLTEEEQTELTNSLGTEEFEYTLFKFWKRLEEKEEK